MVDAKDDQELCSDFVVKFLAIVAERNRVEAVTKNRVKIFGWTKNSVKIGRKIVLVLPTLLGLKLRDEKEQPKRFCQRQNFLSLTMFQPPMLSSVVVVVVVVVGVSVQIKKWITFYCFEIST